MGVLTVCKLEDFKKLFDLGYSTHKTFERINICTFLGHEKYP
jgi:hypothetical protein